MDQKEHELKIRPDFFKQTLNGTLPFEYRKNDRDFKPGDYLWLREWDPDINIGYTGWNLYLQIKEVFKIIPGLPQDYCIMTFGFKAAWVARTDESFIEELIKKEYKTVKAEQETGWIRE
ncbi:hypothetical protein LCGC14_1861960 [marine sediment metagenome]|uniref:DUF3850 domain-containing protein n=1 Tax=marine sediment metagenome TaxID=412755 RepID=A0A0F9ILN6_9ZZZZ